MYTASYFTSDAVLALPKEYSLLKRQRGATILAVVSDMKWLAEKLNDDNVAILNDEQYADVTEVKNTLNEKERAEILVKALLNRVEQDGEELNTFVDILKKKPRKFKALIEKLDTCKLTEITSKHNNYFILPITQVTRLLWLHLATQPRSFTTT